MASERRPSAFRIIERLRGRVMRVLPLALWLELSEHRERPISVPAEPFVHLIRNCYD